MQKNWKIWASVLIVGLVGCWIYYIISTSVAGTENTQNIDWSRTDNFYTVIAYTYLIVLVMATIISVAAIFAPSFWLKIAMNILGISLATLATLNIIPLFFEAIIAWQGGYLFELAAFSSRALGAYYWIFIISNFLLYPISILFFIPRLRLSPSYSFALYLMLLFLAYFYYFFN